MNHITSKIIDNLLTTTLFGKNDSDQHVMTLFAVALQIKAKSILELGVREGTTTAPLLLATSFFNGKLTSIDMQATSYVPPEELKNNHEFIMSDALVFLQECVDAKRTYDLIFVDDNHDYPHVKLEMDLVNQLMTDSTVVILHDLMAEGCEPNYRYGRRAGFADGGPYRAIYELDINKFEWMTIPVNNGLTFLRKRTSAV